MIEEAVKASMTKHFTLAQPLYPEYREGHHRGTVALKGKVGTAFSLIFIKNPSFEGLTIFSGYC
jgi:hypothetical protein